MEFEFNSNDGTDIIVPRDDEIGDAFPSFGPGDGDSFVFSTGNDEVDEEEEEADLGFCTEELFEYPEMLSLRIVQVNDELMRLRQALNVERACLKQDADEVAALRKLDAQVAVAPPPASVSVAREIHAIASPYEPHDMAYVQSERLRHVEHLMHKERYMKQMMEVEQMCSEEFLTLNQTRAKVAELNREVSDWRLNNGRTTGFTPYPLEVMRASNVGSALLPLPMGPSATVPGRFTVNQPMANTGFKSVPNVNLPLPDLMSLPTSTTFRQYQPWVQTFPGAIPIIQRCPRRPDIRDSWKMDENAMATYWKNGDADERVSRVVRY